MARIGHGRRQHAPHDMHRLNRDEGERAGARRRHASGRARDGRGWHRPSTRRRVGHGHGSIEDRARRASATHTHTEDRRGRAGKKNTREARERSGGPERKERRARGERTPSAFGRRRARRRTAPATWRTRNCCGLSITRTNASVSMIAFPQRSSESTRPPWEDGCLETPV